MNRRITRSFRSCGARHEWVKIPVHCAYIYRLLFSQCAIATQDLLLIRQRAVTCWNLNKHEGIQHIHSGMKTIISHHVVRRQSSISAVNTAITYTNEFLPVTIFIHAFNRSVKSIHNIPSFLQKTHICFSSTRTGV